MTLDEFYENHKYYYVALRVLWLCISVICVIYAIGITHVVIKSVAEFIYVMSVSLLILLYIGIQFIFFDAEITFTRCKIVDILTGSIVVTLLYYTLIKLFHTVKNKTMCKSHTSDTYNAFLNYRTFDVNKKNYNEQLNCLPLAFSHNTTNESNKLNKEIIREFLFCIAMTLRATFDAKYGETRALEGYSVRLLSYKENFMNLRIVNKKKKNTEIKVVISVHNNDFVVSIEGNNDGYINFNTFNGLDEKIVDYVIESIKSAK